MNTRTVCEAVAACLNHDGDPVTKRSPQQATTSHALWCWDLRLKRIMKLLIYHTR